MIHTLITSLEAYAPLVIATFEMALIYAPIVMAVWLTTTLLKYNDIAMEASFGFGGALQAMLLASGIPFFVSMPVVMVLGACVGILSGMLHTILKLDAIITGIILIAAFFSINLMITSANVSLTQCETLFTFPTLLAGPIHYYKLILLSGVTALIFFAIRWLLTTQIGFVMHAVGSNPMLVTALGKSPRIYLIATLALAHSIVALSGSLFVQYTSFYSLWSSAGILAIALTGLMIARTIRSRFGAELIIGACAYQAIIAITLSLHMPPEMNRLVTALLLVLLIITQRRSAHA